MAKMKDLHAEWMKDENYQKEYDALEEEFALAQAVIEARVKAGAHQKELARRIHD